MKHLIIYLYISILCVSIAYAQEERTHYELKTNYNESKTFVARDYIKLMPGFTFKASDNKVFEAKIDQALLFPPKDAAYIKPDGTITTNQDEGYAVGEISASFTVSPQGTAIYTVPIKMPQGINSLQPNLAIAYNSHIQLGNLGFKTILQGISSIRRCRKSKYYHDDYRAVKLDENDQFALDGNYLIGLEGNYGHNNSKYTLENNQFKKITSHDRNNNQPGYFKIQNKDGVTYYYGNSDNSKVVINDENVILAWYLSKIIDANGNCIKYIYDNTNTGFAYLKTILYNGNVNTGENYKSKIELLYKPIVSLNQYIQKIQVSSNKLLSQIKVYNNNNLQHTYGFHFNDQNKDLKLRSISFENVEGEKLQPITFDWSCEHNNIGQNPEFSEFKKFTIGDWNRNGKQEIFSLYHPDYREDDQNVYLKIYKLENNIYEILDSIALGEDEAKIEKITDVDHDGYLDVVLTRTNDDIIYCQILDGKLKQLGDNILQTENINRYDKGRVFVADFDGDKEVEILKYYPNVSGYSASYQIYDGSNGEITDFNTPQINRLIIGDFDGDGRKELAGTEGDLKIYFYRVDDKLLNVVGEIESTPHLDRYRIVSSSDINNDGTDDIIMSRGYMIVSDFNKMFEHKFQSIGADAEYYPEVDFNKLPHLQPYVDYIHYLDRSPQRDRFYMNVDFNNDGLNDIMHLVNYRFDLRIEAKDFMADYTDAEGHANFLQTVANFKNAMQNCSFRKTLKYRTHNLSTEPNRGDKIHIYFYSQTAVFKYYQDYTGHFNRAQEIYTNELINISLERHDGQYFFKDDFHSFLNVVDFNNDGYNSLVFTSKNDNVKDIVINECGDDHISLNKQFVTNISTAYENNLHVHYETLIKGDVYSNNNDEFNYDDFHLQVFNFPAVTKVENSRGDDYCYKYRNSVAHLTKGFLGFQAFSSINLTQNVIDEQIFNYLPDYKILLPSVSKKMLGTDVLAKSINNYTLRPVVDKCYNIQLDENIEHDYLSGLNTQTTYDNYDNYGNSGIVTKKFIGSSVIEKTEIEYVTKGSWCPNKVGKITSRKIKGNDEETRCVQYSYDDNGNGLQEIKDIGDINQVVTDYTNLDDYGNPQDINITANGKSKGYHLLYSDCGRYLKEKNDISTGYKTIYTYYEASGQLNTETQSNLNATTSYEYDGFGQLIKTKLPSGGYTVNTFQWANNNGPENAKYYSYVETSGQSPQWIWYDKLGRELRKDTYGFNTSKKIGIRSEYNSKGQIHTISKPFYIGDDPIVETTFNYDSYGRVVSEQSSTGQITYDYSTARQTTITSPSGIKTKIVNGAGQLIKSTVNGRSVNYTYWPSGLLKTATPEGGEAVISHFDLQGNRIKLLDPNAGVVTSNYNGFGELMWQDHKKTNEDGGFETVRSSYIYDNAGRLIASTVKDVTTTNTYYEDTGFLKTVKNPIHEVHYKYDEDSNTKLGRVTSYVEKIDNKILTTQYDYDYFGRKIKHTYPSGYFVTNIYNKYGHLEEIKSKGSVSVWKAQKVNVSGQYTHIKKGNKTTQYGFDDKDLPLSINCPNVIEHVYSFNTQGNLEYREDLLTNQKESFNYKINNQLGGWEVHKNQISVGLFDMNYDDLGNVTHKSDVGYAMAYGETILSNGVSFDAGPNALTSIKGNPSIITDDQQSITYTDFLKVKTITEADNKIEFTYGVDNQRRMAVYKNNDVITKKRYYLGSYEEDVITNGNDRKVHYINGANGLAAIYISSNGSEQLYYAYTDYLGSLTALTDKNGVVVEKYAFDPWGNRRDVNNWQNLIINHSNYITDRGYTMHEHLHTFDLINMNGRIYDAKLSRFLSPDPQLQAPDNWLNYNRYTYALNNPMIYTDPSGEWFQFIYPFVTKWLAGMLDNMINHDMSFLEAVSYSSYTLDGYYSPSDHSYGNAQYDNYAFSKDYTIPITYTNQGDNAWFGNGVHYRQITDNTLIAASFDNDNPTWEYKIIAPQNMGSWGQVGSDGYIHIGCMSCHAPNGAYNFAAYHSRNRMNGDFIAWNVHYAATLGYGAYARSIRATVKTPGQLGLQGERAVGTIGPKTRIPSLSGTANYRIPDQLTKTTLTEVKNVKSLSLTRQINDFHLYSVEKQLQFELYIRPTTTISGPLQNLVDKGFINLYHIPGL